MTRDDEMKKRLRTKLYGFAAAISEGCLMHTESYDLWLDRFYELIPHWISVDDELPPKQPNRERSKNVLVRTNSGRTQIEYYDYGNDVIKEWWKYHVTHWMPLPAPPTSDKTSQVEKGGEQ